MFNRSSISASTEAIVIEQQVKDMIRAVRSTYVADAPTVFCPRLEQALQSYLWMYEMERVVGRQGMRELGGDLVRQVRAIST